MSQTFWNKWLVAVSALTVLMGAGLSALAVFAPEAYAWLLDLVWVGERPAGMTAGGLLGGAIAGGLMAGMGAWAFLLARGGAFLESELARKAFLYGLVTWYVVDSAASVAVGAAWNVVGNTLFLLMFEPALLALGSKRYRPLETVSA